MGYRVNWDNGTEACGTFPQDFPTREEAERFGEDWVAGMVGMDDNPEAAEASYTFDVIEVADATCCDCGERVPEERRVYDCAGNMACPDCADAADAESDMRRAALDHRGQP